MTLTGSAVFAILAVAALLRLWALDTQPGGLYPDEAAEAIDAHRLLFEPNFHPVFFQDDAGREAMYGYMVAAAFRVFGESVTVLRGTSAILGVLAVVAAYLWLRREGALVALGGAAWAAGSLWLLCVSRDGMRNVLVPVAGMLALWGMGVFGRRPTRWSALVCGGAMALGLWTYQPLKLLPLLFLLWLAWIRHLDRERWRALQPELLWVGLAYLVVGAPLIYVALNHPGLYFGRAVGVSAAGQHTGLGGLLVHTARTLAMFAVTGDPNERHNVGGAAMLGWPLTLLALLGAWRAWRGRRDPLNSLVLVAIPVFLFPPLVATADAAPHFLRSLGLAAPLAALVGMGGAEVYEHWAHLEPRRRGGLPGWAAPAAVAALLAATAALSGYAYLTRPVSRRFDAYAFNVVQLADALRTARHHTTTQVVIDAYRATDLRFLDRTQLEGGSGVFVVDPSTKLRDGRDGGPLLSCRQMGLSLGDLRGVFGGFADRALPIAHDPNGAPTVWEASCGAAPKLP